MCCFPCDSTTLEVFFIVFSCFFYVSCGSSYSNKSLLQSKDILCHICRLLHKVFCFPEGRSWSKMLSCKWWSSHSLRNGFLGDVCPVLHRCWFLPGPAATSIHLPIPEANRQWSSMVRGETFIIKSCWFPNGFAATWYVGKIAKELRLQLSSICYTCRAYILPSCCILQELPLYISGNGSMERCGYQRWHWGFKTAPASQGFNKVMTVDTMGRSPNFSIAGWSRANLLATPRHSVMFFLEKSTWIRFI